MPNQKVSGAASGAIAGAAAGSIVPGIGTVIGGVVGGVAGYFGSADSPDVILPKQIDPQDSAAKSIAGSKSNLPSILELTQSVDVANQDQAMALLERSIPGFKELQKSFLRQAATDINDPYGVPEDVERAISQKAAERGITRGTSGGFNDLSFLADFGRSSLDEGNRRIQRSIQTLSTLRSLTPTISPLSPAAFFINPADQFAADQDYEYALQNAKQGGENSRTAVSNSNNQRVSENLMGALGAYFGGSSFAGLAGNRDTGNFMTTESTDRGSTSQAALDKLTG